MSYEYEPIKDLEKEIDYVRWNHEKTTHSHQKEVIGTQLKKLEARLHKFKQAEKVDEYEAKAKAFDEIKNSLHDAQSSIDRSGNRKEERDHAVAFFNSLVEMDILEVYERNERDD